MTKNLRKKMMRDLRQNFVQFLAIFVMCFFAMYVLEAFDSDHSGNSDAIDRYYRDTNFMDLYAVSEGFTDQDIIDIKQLPDVKDAELRATINGKVKLGEDRKVEFNFIRTNNISKMLLFDGEPYEEGKSGIWIDRNFASTYGIVVGDSLQCVCDGIAFDEPVRGIMDNPEHLYFMIDDTYTEPEIGEYGFAFLDAGEYPGIRLNYEYAYVDLNTVENQFLLDDHDIQMLDNARMEILGALSKTALSVVTKNRQEGFSSYSGDMAYDAMMGTVFPLLFTLIAMLGIVTTMTRLVTKQRTLIGTLKALGFSQPAVMIHYISFVVIIALTGSIAGTVAGWWTLGKQMNYNMNLYYSNPYERMALSSKPVIVILLISVMAGMVNFFACRKLLVQRASDILRPEPPAVMGAGMLEKTFLWKFFDFATKWNLRDINRNKGRTVMGILGVTLTSALMLTSFGANEVNHMIDAWQYDDLTPANYTVTFNSNAGYGVVYDYAKAYEGQMIQNDSAEVTHGGMNRMYNVTIVDEGNLCRFQDENGEFTKLPDHEIAISARVAEYFDIGVGDIIDFKFLSNKQVYRSRVGLIFKTPGTQGLAMTRKCAEELTVSFEPNLLYTDMSVPTSFMKDRPEISSVIAREDYIKAVRDRSEGTDETVTYTMVIAIIVGVVVMYNLGVLSFIEKAREIATLKVLGFPTKKIRWILQQQNILVTGLGTAAGLILGIKFLEIIMGGMDDEVDYIFTLSPVPYLCAFSLSFILSLIVNGLISAKVKEINMVEALKGVE